MAKGGIILRIGMYPGTFDPVTCGHINIAERALELFDKVIIAIAHDNYKKTLFTLEERKQMVEEAVGNNPRFEVCVFDGLLVDFCMEKNATAIIRGLRAVSDYEWEFQMALMNKSMNPEIETIFLMSEHKYMFISSTIIKNSALLGGKVTDLVPLNVEKALYQKALQENNNHHIK